MQRAICIPARFASNLTLKRPLQHHKYFSCIAAVLKSFNNDNDRDYNSKPKSNANDSISLQSSNPSSDDENLTNPLEVKLDEASLSIDTMILNSSNYSEPVENGKVAEESEFMNDDDIAAEILNVALEFVPQYGWSDRSIEEAIKILELSPSSAGMFKRGPVDLVLHFIERCNNDLSEYMSELSEAKRQSQDKAKFIEAAIQKRLKMIIPYIGYWPQALTLLASPAAAADCLENGAHMVDEIWYYAGDVSMDMSWYTKRAALAGIFASTELYMLRDNSVDFKDTWGFLQRRLEDFRAAEITKNSVAHAMNDFYALASAGFTTAQNILGMNSRNR